MFTKAAVESNEAERAEGGRGGMGLTFCEGTRGFAVHGRNLMVMGAGCLGGPIQRETLPLPGGRVVALGSGPSVLMADATLYFWQSERWNRVGNLFDGPQS